MAQLDHDKQNFEYTIRLYELYSKSLENYNGIIWQYPTAYLTLNGGAIALFLGRSPLLLIALGILNFLLLFHIAKHIHNQTALIGALRNIESQLPHYYPPNFVPRWQSKNVILKHRAAHWVTWSFFVFNIIFLIFVSGVSLTLW